MGISHIIIILDGEPVVVDHPKGDDGSGTAVVSLGHVMTPLTDWDAFDHAPSMIQIVESDPERLEKMMKFCKKLCKD